MIGRPRGKRILRALVGAALLAGAAGCLHWRPRPTSAPPAGEVRVHYEARVTTAREVMVLKEVQVRPDSVFGYRRAADGILDQVRLSRDEVRILEVQQVEPLRTVGFLVLGIGAVWAALVYITLSTEAT